MRWKDFQVVKRRRADGEQCRETWQKRQCEKKEIKHKAKLVFQANPNGKCKRGIKKKAI